jgi:ankyrin repeat protein
METCPPPVADEEELRLPGIRLLRELAPSAGCVDERAALDRIDVPVIHALPEGSYAMTPLMIAASGGREEELRSLLHLGADPAAPADKRGRTAAHEAAASQHVRCLALLPVATLSAQAKGGVRPAHIAAEAGSAAALRLIAQKAGAEALHTSVKGGWEPAHFAAASGHRSCLREIALSGGVGRCVGRDKHGRTPMHLAAAGGHESCLRELLEAEPAALLRQRDSDGRTALHCAAYGGHGACLELGRALCGEAALEAPDHDGQTAAHYAAKRGHESVLGLLASVLGAEAAWVSPNG